jgi:hypothetical protein
MQGFDDIEIPNNYGFNTNCNSFDDLEIPDAETLISRLKSKKASQTSQFVQTVPKCPLNTENTHQTSTPIDDKTNIDIKQIIKTNHINIDKTRLKMNVSKQSNKPTLILPSHQPSSILTLI